jgi:hypothetical protein
MYNSITFLCLFVNCYDYIKKNIGYRMATLLLITLTRRVKEVETEKSYNINKFNKFIVPQTSSFCDYL